MTRLKLQNLTKDIEVLDDIIIAESFFSRLKGLLGKKGLDKGQGLVIRPCNSVHTIGMKFSIDLAFVNEDNQVIHIIQDLKPGKLSPIIKGSKFVIEVASGEFSHDNLEIGDIIEIKSQP